jgi:hypothetical protein
MSAWCQQYNYNTELKLQLGSFKLIFITNKYFTFGELIAWEPVSLAQRLLQHDVYTISSNTLHLVHAHFLVLSFSR